MSAFRIGVDVGGTFTDLVAVAGGRVVTAKVPTTADQSEAVIHAIEAAGIRPEDVDAFSHGTTVATNALLERKGARTALVTTEGFRDVLEIGRQNRPSLYDLTLDRPPALVARDLRFTVAERMGPEGEQQCLDDGSVQAAVESLRAAGVESVAVCLLFSYLHPEHERRVGEAVRGALPDAHVSLSCDVLPEFREYERCSTTAADAYLGPVLGLYLGRLVERCSERGLRAPVVMQSSGGVTDAHAAACGAAAFVLSGPAAGVVGAAEVARAGGFADVLSFDMGGTSTDVAPVVGGEPGTTTESSIAGVPLKLPMTDVHTVGAGGGSIAWTDEGGGLRVGPQSAGADPGPACYGKGGKEPTVTDANLVLGYLGDGTALGGDIRLDRAAARDALAGLAAELGLEASELAHGIVEVANAEMSRALRVITVERGLDPREFALAAFGGAGPLHACALAEELDIEVVLVPQASGVLSALGLAIAEVRRDYVTPLLAEVARLDGSAVEDAFSAMETSARGELDGPRFRRRADLRYKGQSFELTIDAGCVEELAPAFHAAHEQRYGYRMEQEPVELVALRVVATVPAPHLEWPATEPGEAQRRAGKRHAYFDGRWVETEVLARDGMGPGHEVRGPAIVEMAESTAVIRPGWAGRVDDTGTLVLRRR
jgi:N-methylhydantoinase A